MCRCVCKPKILFQHLFLKPSTIGITSLLCPYWMLASSFITFTTHVGGFLLSSSSPTHSSYTHVPVWGRVCARALTHTHTHIHTVLQLYCSSLKRVFILLYPCSCFILCMADTSPSPTHLTKSCILTLTEMIVLFSVSSILYWSYRYQMHLIVLEPVVHASSCLRAIWIKGSDSLMEPGI